MSREVPKSGIFRFEKTRLAPLKMPKNGQKTAQKRVKKRLFTGPDYLSGSNRHIQARWYPKVVKSGPKRVRKPGFRPISGVQKPRGLDPDPIYGVWIQTPGF